ncbi:DNA-processing protein DprA [Fulvivirga sp.]|uniref:DNA-processing protein DprA n=2 Tax=Fulvivirga sp. TaxID=1931237 RepID=UPI0032EAD4EA
MAGQDRLAQLALNFIPGIGHMLVKQLVSYCGSAEAVFKTPKSKLLKIPGIGAFTADSISKDIPMKRAEVELNKCDKEGVQILLHTDKAFPKRLNHINDAPSLLYYKGAADLNSNKIVSIVGTRKATAYGKEITEHIIEHLAPHNPVIVSGLAYGIDIHAHKSALKHNLSTIGVLASGVNVIYPAIHRDTANKMIEHGALISENPLDAKPDAPKFPARNRIIAGMADAIVVVEAAAKGGALITAEIANSYNKDVFAVPGNVNSEFSLGCNNLIRSNKAHLINSGKDIEYIMNWEANNPEAGNKLPDLSELNEDELTIVNALVEHVDGMMIDNLSWKTSLSVSQLASILLNLEFKGLVISLPGKKFKLAINK